MNLPLSHFASIIAFVFAFAFAPAIAARADSGGASNAGAALVQSNGCAGCHGANLQGATGPKLYGIEHRRSAAAIANAIENPKSPMPKFQLSEVQVSRIVAYLSSLDGGGGVPSATLDPAKPASSATLTVRFPGTPPKHVSAVPEMQMGSSSMQDATVTLRPTSDPHVWRGKVSFSMGGPYTIDVRYDGRHLTVPVSVGGGSM